MSVCEQQDTPLCSFLAKIWSLDFRVPYFPVKPTTLGNICSSSLLFKCILRSSPKSRMYMTRVYIYIYTHVYIHTSCTCKNIPANLRLVKDDNLLGWLYYIYVQLRLQMNRDLSMTQITTSYWNVGSFFSWTSQCWPFFFTDVSSSTCSFDQWWEWEPSDSTVLQSFGLEGLDPEVFSTSSFAACHFSRTRLTRDP